LKKIGNFCISNYLPHNSPIFSQVREKREEEVISTYIWSVVESPSPPPPKKRRGWEQFFRRGSFFSGDSLNKRSGEIFFLKILIFKISVKSTK